LQKGLIICTAISITNRIASKEKQWYYEVKRSEGSVKRVLSGKLICDKVNIKKTKEKKYGK